MVDTPFFKDTKECLKLMSFRSVYGCWNISKGITTVKITIDTSFGKSSSREETLCNVPLDRLRSRGKMKYVDWLRYD